MTSGESTNHDQTSTHSSEETLGTKLTSHLDQATSDSLSRKSLGLVDLGKEGVGGLGDDGSSETSDETRAEVKCRDGAGGKLALGLAG